MSLPRVVSREKWEEARKKLLVAEKRMTKQRDKLNTKRRILPIVKIDKEYKFGDRTASSLCRTCSTAARN